MLFFEKSLVYQNQGVKVSTQGIGIMPDSMGMIFPRAIRMASYRLEANQKPEIPVEKPLLPGSP